MNFTHDFAGDLETILAAIAANEPFAFNRFADGELAILEGRDIPTADGWSATNVSDDFKRRLEAALTYRDDGYYVGISCPCCDREGWQALMLRAGRNEFDDTVTTSNVFVNGNFVRFTSWIAQRRFSIWKPDINLVNGHQDLIDHAIRAFSDPSLPLPLLVAAGPAGKIVIAELWKNGVRHRPIIDVGSALEVLLGNTATRSYHDPNHPNRSKVCQWTPKALDKSP